MVPYHRRERELECMEKVGNWEKWKHACCNDNDDTIKLNNNTAKSTNARVTPRANQPQNLTPRNECAPMHPLSISVAMC